MSVEVTSHENKIIVIKTKIKSEGKQKLEIYGEIQTPYHYLPSVESPPSQQVQPNPPLPLISHPPQFHHAFFHLKSTGYTDLGLIKILSL
ncbi:Hypothetical predicted protein [Octopus vulgaris]|uniref:Uncharacterized protein n=1 Tax=Octopus vulgaris TaxID=6645 RepID=A0AA36BYW8_OCTVU|nr:Hypothetical predicted protein [Octopus vulgaris]